MLSYALIGYFAQKPAYRYLKALYSIRVNNKADKYMWIIKIPSLKDIKEHNIEWWRGTLYFVLRTTIGSKIINRIFSLIKQIKCIFHSNKIINI